MVRTHDPSIFDCVMWPKKKLLESSQGYVGYIFKSKDKNGKAPHELLPLDFFPNGLTYPWEWKNMFGTRSYLACLHVPSDFASKKNELLRETRRHSGWQDSRHSWNEMPQDLRQYSHLRNRRVEQPRK